MKFLFVLLVLSFFVFGCVAPSDTVCNYDGVCSDDETDDCVDCADVIGRGVPVPPVDDDSLIYP